MVATLSTWKVLCEEKAALLGLCTSLGDVVGFYSIENFEGLCATTSIIEIYINKF